MKISWKVVCARSGLVYSQHREYHRACTMAGHLRDRLPDHSRLDVRVVPAHHVWTTRRIVQFSRIGHTVRSDRPGWREV